MAWDYRCVSGIVLRASEKAVLLETEERGERRTTWVPRSVIEDGEAVEPFESDIYVASWFCEKEGI